MRRHNQYPNQHDQLGGNQQWPTDDYDDFDTLNEGRRSSRQEGTYDQNWQEHAGNQSSQSDRYRGYQQGGSPSGYQGGYQSGGGYNQGSQGGFSRYGGYPQHQPNPYGYPPRQSWSPSQGAYQHRGDEDYGQYNEGRYSNQQRFGQRPQYGSSSQGFPRSGEVNDYQSSGYGSFRSDDERTGQFGSSSAGQYPGQFQNRTSWGGESQRGGAGTGSSGRSQRGAAPRSYKRTDERIQEDVCEQLMDAGIDCSNVDVSVTIGVVSLTGEVNNREDKHQIERVAANVSGVQDVDNRIKLARQTRKDLSSSGDSDRSGNGASGGYSMSGSTSGSTSKSSDSSSSTRK
jgi:osmotically-inducible protein OsmY